MIDKKLRQEIENQMIDFQAKFIIEILEKLLQRKASKSDGNRIKIVPVIGKSMTSMISFDNVIIGILEGSFDHSGGKVSYVCNFIPAVDYEKENPASSN